MARGRPPQGRRRLRAGARDPGPSPADAVGRAPSGGSLALGSLLVVFTVSARGADGPSASEDDPRPWYDFLKDIEAGPGRLDISLGVRLRLEHLDGFTILGYGPPPDGPPPGGAGEEGNGRDPEDDVLLLRTRLSLDYRFAEGAHAFVELQDARYWLSDLSLSDFGASSSYYDQFDLRQAYFEWRRIGDTPLGVKLGRQIMLYGDRRLFAPAEWGNVGNYWWDAATLAGDTEALQVDAFHARRVLSEPESWNTDHWPYHVGAVYARVKKLPLTLDAFYVLKYDGSGGSGATGGGGAGEDEARHTFGMFSERPAGDGWDYGFFAAVQRGDLGDDDIRAYGVCARGGYTFAAAWTPRFGFEVNYASGDRDPDDGVRGTFDGIFGAMDIPYGWMNVVSWRNLEDYALNASVRPVGSVKLSAEYHYFRLAQARDAWYWISGKPERRDPTGQAGRDLGHEVDLIIRWQATRELEMLFGYARFFPGAFVRNTPGGHGAADWAFAQFDYAF